MKPRCYFLQLVLVLMLLAVSAPAFAQDVIQTAAETATCPTGVNPETDFDGDCVDDTLEREGYDSNLDACTAGDDNPGCYVTDPTSWSSDGDPYSDFQEATGVNMDNTINAPFNGPLVAAMPRIEIHLVRYEFAPKELITDSQGNSISSSDTQEFTTESSISSTITSKVEVEAGVTGGVSSSVEASVSASITESQTNSQTRGQEMSWETATATNSDEAATLSLHIVARNTGSATALEVRPTFNLYIGDDLVGTITPSEPFPANLRPDGDDSDVIVVSDKRVGNDDVPLTLTIRQLRRLQRGAPIKIQVIGLEAGISRWRPEDSNWSCPDPCEWEEFENQIEARTLRMHLEFGYSGDPNAEIPREYSGNPFEYRVFTGSPSVSPNFTLRDLLGFIDYDTAQQGDELVIEGRSYPSEWYVTSGPDEGGTSNDSTFYDYWVKAGEPENILDMVMPRSVALLMASPDPVDPGPLVRGEFLTESTRGITVAATPKGSIPVEGGEAHLVFTGGHELTIPLERIPGTSYFAIPDSQVLPIALESSHVVMRDVLGNERTLMGIGYSGPLPETCSDIDPEYYRAPRFTDTEEGTRDGIATVYLEGDPNKPATAFCLDDGAGADFWFPQTNDMGTADVNAVHVLDLERRVAAGDNAILHSENGGLSWQRADVAAEDLMVFRGLAFREGTETGIAVGDGGVFLRTEDGGLTWTRAVGNMGGGYLEVDYAGGETWYAVGGGRVRRSTDDGRTWETASVHAVDENGEVINPVESLGFANLTAVNFISDSVGVIGDALMNTTFYDEARGRVYATYDGGETWRFRATFTNINDIAFDGDSAWYNIGRNVIQRIPVYPDESAVVFTAATSHVLIAGSFATPEIGFVQSEGGVVFRTDDGGDTWISPTGGYPTPTHPGANFMRDIHMLDANIGASVGTEGVIGATDSGGGVLVQVVNTGVEEDPSFDELPSAMTLEQNYPNPFNPSTTIRYRLEQAQDVRLEIFDVMGRRLATLQAGAQPAGTHEVRFDATGYASGVYVYRLTSASSTAVRTMLLLR